MGRMLDFEVLRLVKIYVAITQKLFAIGQQKLSFLESSLHWLSKKIKMIFIGTTSQNLESSWDEMCCNTHVFGANLTSSTSFEEIA